MQERLEPKVRQEQIMDAALMVAARVGYMKIERADIAKAAGCAESSVSRYYGTMNQLRRAVIRHAVKVGHHKIIAQGLAVNDKHALKAPEDIRKAAIKSMLTTKL